MDEQPNEMDRNVTIKALRHKTKSILSSLLNPIKILPTDKGLQRDWHGLADLCEIEGQYIPNMECNNDPTSNVLNLWYENNSETSTIQNLLSYLEEMDRYDVIYDIKELLDDDIKYYKQNPNDGAIKRPNLDADKYILTNDDVSRLNEGLELQNYDAFVLFADDDINFASQIIEVLEKEYNMKLCTKDRDLVGGGFEHDSIIKLISERCNRLIVIVSNEFFKSSANKFFYTFAQAIGIEQKQRKIIPCLYKHCDYLPPELTCYYRLDYRLSGGLYNFWQKLHSAIKAPQLAQHPPVNKSLSDIPPESTAEATNTLRALHPRVKFNSMVNLNSPDSDKIILDQNMMASTSSNSLTVDVKKLKSKYNWLKKILHQKNTHHNDDNHKTNTEQHNTIEIEKKKRFWSRHSKRKLAVAS